MRSLLPSVHVLRFLAAGVAVAAAAAAAIAVHGHAGGAFASSHAERAQGSLRVERP
jgi:hypothetical protein